MNPRKLSTVAISILSFGCSEQPTTPGIVVASLIPASATSTASVAGTDVLERPTVLVRDQHDKPVAGFAVIFSIVSVGGSVTGGETVTDAEGRATVGAWTLPRKLGVNTLVASHGILKVPFTAIGIAGPAARVIKVGGDNQISLPGGEVLSSPAVRVEDINENPVQGVQVTFEVISGGGSLVNGIVTTDLNGIARAGAWKLGGSDTQSISASVAGVAPVIFSAIVTTDACRALTLLNVGATIALDLNSSGCPVESGRTANRFGFHASQFGQYSFKQVAPAFESHTTLATANGVPIGEGSSAGVGLAASIEAILVPGDYVVTTTSVRPGASGAYTLASTAGPPQSKCDDVFLSLGVTLAETMARTDCPNSPLSSRLEHRFRIYLEAGKLVTITLATNSFDNRIELYGHDGDYLGVAEENVSYSTLDSRLIYQVSASGYYVVRVVAEYGEGPYALSIE